MTEERGLLHQFSEDSGGSFVTPQLLLMLLVFICLGIGTGFLLAKVKHPLTTTQANKMITASDVKTGTTYGSNDTSTFKDMAEGIMAAGGIDGEGQNHLVRSGGDSQNVYLTSSSVDLSQFTGHKVKVWGQTQKAKKAGWLMDVGRVEVEN